MANIYVGFHDQRSCNRILKPPGGGTSNIFGTDPPPAKKEDSKSIPGTPTKETVEETKTEEPQVEKCEAGDGNGENQEPQLENLSIADENGEKQETEPSEKRAEPRQDTISSIIRQNDKIESPVVETEKKSAHRVPPGGFSSGLW